MQICSAVAPQTNNGNIGALPNLGTSCCTLIDPTKLLFGVAKSGSGICTGGRLVSDSFVASIPSLTLMLLSRLPPCTRMLPAAKLRSRTQLLTKTSSFPLDAPTLAVAILELVSRRTGWFTVPFALACPSCAVCYVPQLTCVFAASHLSVSIVVSCPCPPLLSHCCQLQAPNFTAFVSGAMSLAVLIARLNFFEIQATSQENIVVIYRPN